MSGVKRGRVREPDPISSMTERGRKTCFPVTDVLNEHRNDMRSRAKQSMSQTLSVLSESACTDRHMISI